MKIFKLLVAFILTAGLFSHHAQSNSKEKLIFIDKYDSNGDFAVAERERILLDGSNFDFFDKDNDHKISKDEYLSLSSSLINSQIHSEYQGQIKQTVIRFSSLDDDSNRKITFDEFSMSSKRIFSNFDLDENEIVNATDKELLSKQKNQSYDSEKVDDRDEESMKRISRRVSSAKYLLRMPSTHSLDGFLVQYDNNNSHSVSLKSFSEQRRAIFDTIDTNKNSWLSDEEYIAEYQSRLEARVKTIKDENVPKRSKQFAAYDSNTDNGISRKEFFHHHQTEFIRLDTDNDGFISLDDKAAAITLSTN